MTTRIEPVLGLLVALVLMPWPAAADAAALGQLSNSTTPCRASSAEGPSPASAWTAERRAAEAAVVDRFSICGRRCLGTRDSGILGDDRPGPTPELLSGPEAPLALLGAYASEPWDDASTGELPDELRQRILEAALRYPERLPEVLPRLPTDADAVSRVRAVFDAAPAQEWFFDGWGEEVGEWLDRVGDRLSDAVLEAARSAADDEDGGVRGEDELRLLAARDPEAARPVLHAHLAAAPSRVATLAASLLYGMAVEAGEREEAEHLRRELQRIVEDRSAPGYSRDCAAEALLTREWPGRDAWYLRLFQDPTLLRLDDGMYLVSPLRYPVEDDPDAWIPRLTELVASEERAVHDQAVDLLVRFQLDAARADALRPLLPWLQDPTWSSAGDRLRLVQSVDRVGLREAIPGLIQIVANEDELAEWAAESLGTFRAPEAVPALRAALSRLRGASERRRVARALVACGGASVDEEVAALEALAVQLSTDAGRAAFQEYRYSLFSETAPDPLLSLGEVLLADDFEPSDGLVDAVHQVLPELAERDRAAAAELRTLVGGWSSARLDRAAVEALAAGDLDGKAIAALLRRRAEVAEHAAPRLACLAGGEGLVAGTAAVLLGEAAPVERILAQGEADTRAALFAAARLAGTALPVAAVGDLLAKASSTHDGEAAVARAVELYLEANDSPPARRLLLAVHPGEARILGRRLHGDPGHVTYEHFDAVEEKLRQTGAGGEGAAWRSTPCSRRATGGTAATS